MYDSIVKDIQNIIDNTAKTHEIDGKVYTNSPLSLVRHKDRAKEIVFNDLSSLIPIMKNECEKFNLPFYLVIEDYNKVEVYTALDGDKDREHPYGVKCDNNLFHFDFPYNYENFVIALRSLFVQNENSENLLKFLKTVTSNNSVEVEDDGITQKVTSSKGILGGKATVSPIQRLTPFRTFTEIEQPTSEFLFRIMNNGSFALYEADGGAWKKQAKANIKEYYSKAFATEIKKGTIIIVG